MSLIERLVSFFFGDNIEEDQSRHQC